MAVDDFFCWLNTNSGILTLLTAIATFITCWCSFISAKATRAQVEEMRRQYKEENRPFIGTELTYVSRTFYGIKFINHGKQTAYHVKIQFDRSFIDSLPEKVYQTLLLEQEGRECIIGINQNYTIFVGTNKMRNYSTLQSASGTILYCGPGGENYEDKFQIDIKNYMTIFSVTGKEDDLIKRLDIQNTQQKETNKILWQIFRDYSNSKEKSDEQTIGIESPDEEKE